MPAVNPCSIDNLLFWKNEKPNKILLLWLITCIVGIPRYLWISLQEWNSILEKVCVSSLQTSHFGLLLYAVNIPFKIIWYILLKWVCINNKCSVRFSSLCWCKTYSSSISSVPKSSLSHSNAPWFLNFSLNSLYSACLKKYSWIPANLSEGGVLHHQNTDTACNFIVKQTDIQGKTVLWV